MKNDWVITNIRTGETKSYNPASELGKKSVKARHKGKSKKQLSEMYSKIRKGNK